MKNERTLDIRMGTGPDAIPQVSTEATPPPRPPELQEQFDDGNQQREVATLGMWIFLITEIMFFGGLFVAYLVYRSVHPLAFMIGSEHLSYGFGTAMTATLLLSSLTMTLAEHGARVGNQSALRKWLYFTLILGVIFLTLKGLEYREHILRHELPGRSFFVGGALPLAHHVELFFVLYWCMTGLHAIHMLVGLGLIVWLLTITRRMTPEFHNPVDNVGLYWHFVDVIWIYLYPLLYLIGRWR